VEPSEASGRSSLPFSNFVVVIIHQSLCRESPEGRRQFRHKLERLFQILKIIDSRFPPRVAMCLPPSASASQPQAKQKRDPIDIESTDFPEGVKSSEICVNAWKLVSESLDESIVNHSARVFLLAHRLANVKPVPLQTRQLELLFVACILHDIGTCSTYDGPQRFEVEGADAAASLLRANGFSETEAHDVWVAIALHTSPGIAERISELASLVRRAVLIDFGKADYDLSAEVWRGDMEGLWPRLDIERKLGDAVVMQAIKRPYKAPPASWPGVLYRSALENQGWDGVNKAF
jgi:hypothetical protein